VPVNGRRGEGGSRVDRWEEERGTDQPRESTPSSLCLFLFRVKKGKKDRGERREERKKGKKGEGGIKADVST